MFNINFQFYPRSTRSYDGITPPTPIPLSILSKINTLLFFLLVIVVLITFNSIQDQQMIGLKCISSTSGSFQFYPRSTRFFNSRRDRSSEGLSILSKINIKKEYAKYLQTTDFQFYPRSTPQAVLSHEKELQAFNSIQDQQIPDSCRKLSDFIPFNSIQDQQILNKISAILVEFTFNSIQDQRVRTRIS